MNTTQPRRTPRVALVTLTIIILMALAFITPQGRAFAQSILQFFIRSESDVLPVATSGPVTWVDVTAGVPVATKTPQPAMAIFANDCGDYGYPACTVEQIRSKVNFTVKEPASTPEGLYFVGATGGPDSIYILYYYEGQTGSLSVTMDRWSGAPSSETSLVGASAVVEQVRIGDLLGEYFKGSFVYQSGEDISTWDPEFEVETLRWVDNGVSYTMQYSYPSAMLGKTGMVALAESMTTENITKLPMPAPTVDPYAWDPKEYWNLSISEAEQQAGFKLSLPVELPEILSFVGAMYEEKHGYVQVNYETLQGVSLLVSQQVAPNSEGCVLCDISIGDYNDVKEGNSDEIKLVPADANLEIVQVGAVPGKYVEGVWSGTDCCGWVWDPQPFLKTLRWWKDGVAFEIMYGGLELEKAELIRIAESIQ